MQYGRDKKRDMGSGDAWSDDDEIPFPSSSCCSWFPLANFMTFFLLSTKPWSRSSTCSMQL